MIMSGCSAYHYVDTCTRSQFLVQSPWTNQLVLPPLNDPEEQCNRKQWSLP